MKILHLPLAALMTLIVAACSVQPQAATPQTGLHELTAANASAIVPLTRLHTDSPVYTVAFIPDTPLLASGEKDGTLLLWNTLTGEREAQLAQLDTPVRNIAIDSEGSLLAAAAWDGRILLWDLEALEERHVLEGHDEAASSVSFSPDGTRLVSGGWDHAVRVWDVQSGTLLAAHFDHSAPVLSVDFHTDGNRIVSGGWDNMVYVRDLGGDSPVYSKGPYPFSITAVLFDNSHEDRIIFSTTEDKVHLVNTESDKGVAGLGVHTGGTWGLLTLAQSPNGQFVATAGSSWNSVVYVWDLGKDKRFEILSGHRDFVWSVAFSPDGSLLASGSQDHTIQLWGVISE